MSGFLFELTECAVKNCNSSDVVKIDFGVQQSRVHWPLMGYADYSTPADRSSLACFVIRDMKIISEWCDTYVMKVKPRWFVVFGVTSSLYLSIAQLSGVQWQAVTLPYFVVCVIAHTRLLSATCMFFRIILSVRHFVCSLLPPSLIV